MGALPHALQPLFAPAFTLWASPFTWFELVAFVLESADGCSAASTSRTGSRGSRSTSSAGLFAYKGPWLTVLLSMLFIGSSVLGFRAWQRVRVDA